MSVDVSVIIPTYNRLWCLPRAVNSCRGACCETEIVVVDDGSTDGTQEWLLSQPDVVTVCQPNQGQTWAVNNGVARSRGRFLRFLDSDDFLEPGAIDRQFETACLTGAGVVYSRVDELHEPNARRVIQEEPPPWDDFMAVVLGEGACPHFLGMLFARELVEKAPRRPEFALREDRSFLLEIALQDPLARPSPGCAGCWVKHSNQMHDTYRGAKITVANWQYLSLYRRILAELRVRDQLTPRRKRAAANMMWPAIHGLASVHLGDAEEHYHWLCENLAPGFCPPVPSLLGTLYRFLGFRATQRLLRLRRFIVGRHSG